MACVVPCSQATLGGSPTLGKARAAVTVGFFGDPCKRMDVLESQPRKSP